jgi:hypothetical protein
MGIPIPIPMKGGNGAGSATASNEDKNGKINKSIGGTPKQLLVDANGKNGQITVDARASKEFIKWASTPSKGSKYKPNSTVKGVRNNSPHELQMNFKGDPDGQYVAGTPLYQQYLSGKRSLESPVNKEQIPAAYRKQVKEYFESINPTGK